MGSDFNMGNDFNREIYRKRGLFKGHYFKKSGTLILLKGFVLSTFLGCSGGDDGLPPSEGPPQNNAPIDNSNPNSSPDSADNTPNPSDASLPNILLIIADDMGVDTFSPYLLTNDSAQTPHLESLAASGIVFENTWATPACTTTRGSIITGQHGIHSSVDQVPDFLPLDAETLQKQFNDSDYQTAVIGKWHLSGGNQQLVSHPNEVGVDYYAGTLAGTISNYYEWILTQEGEQFEESTYHTTKVTDLAIQWVKQQVDNPWFLWLAYVAPHSPFHVPPNELLSQPLSGNDDDIEANKRKYYLAAIEAMDTEIGRLLDSLSDETRDNTLIIFIGDNGTPKAVLDTAVFRKPHSKGTLYEGGIRVPMVVSGKGVDRKQETESALINTVDFYPTILELASLPIPSDINGKSFHSLLSDAVAAPPREYNYSEFISDTTSGWAVRNERYKLIEFADGTREFYDLSILPLEQNNLWPISEDLSNVAESLVAYVETIRAPLPDNFPQNPDNSDDPEDPNPIDLTDALLKQTSDDCADYINSYHSQAWDHHEQKNFTGTLTISQSGTECTFATNAIPNHEFNDGNRGFPNKVSEQSKTYTIPTNPTLAQTITPLSLTRDNAILLNGVKVDVLAAGCYGVGNGKVGCNDIDQPWRYDPMHSANGFTMDSHHAHTQPDGTYHYHGTPNALFDPNSQTASPVVGFAADGFPIMGSRIEKDGRVTSVQSSYRLKQGSRESGDGNPGGQYDGSFRDDYEYISGIGDLDECNGMTNNGKYAYYITEDFPYWVNCFKGTPHESFLKR